MAADLDGQLSPFRADAGGGGRDLEPTRRWLLGDSDLSIRDGKRALPCNGIAILRNAEGDSAVPLAVRCGGHRDPPGLRGGVPRALTCDGDCNRSCTAGRTE